MTPVADDPDRAGGRMLLDACGEPLGRFLVFERDGRPHAELFTLADGVAPADAVGPISADRKGWTVIGEPTLGRALMRAGARARRHAHMMTRDLVRDPAPCDWPEPAGVRLAAVDRPALDLAPACLAAYPREHPDYPEIATPDQPELELEEIMSGRLIGPLLRASGLALAPDGRGRGRDPRQRHCRRAALRRALDRTVLPASRRARAGRTAAAPRARDRHARRLARARPCGHARQPGDRAVRGARVRGRDRNAPRRAIAARKPRSRGAFIRPVMDHR